MADLDIISPLEKDEVPSEKDLWKVGSAIVTLFRNKPFLEALYADERISDIMYRYFSGESLAQIGDIYDISRERVRQLCDKSLRKLMHHLSYFTKDVVEVFPEKNVETAPRTNKTKGSSWTEQDLALLKDLRVQGKYIKEIAVLINRPRREVSKKLTELGLRNKNKNPEVITEEESQEIVARFKANSHLSEIAEDYSIRQIDVARILMKAGVFPAENSRSGVSWDSSESERLLSYVERGYSINEIKYILGRDYREVTSKMYTLLKGSIK